MSHNCKQPPFPVEATFDKQWEPAFAGQDNERKEASTLKDLGSIYVSDALEKISWAVEDKWIE